MTTQLTIGGKTFVTGSFSISEQVVSLVAGDSSGGVGTFDIAVRRPGEDARMEGNRLLAKYGPDFFIGDAVTLQDDRWGTISGRVRDCSRNDQDGSISFTCFSTLEKLNVVRVKAKPFVGTLENAIKYYLGLAGVTSGYSIDSFLAPRPVRYIGFVGELWYHLKMLCQAQDMEIALVNNVITFRPTRRIEINQSRDLTRGQSRQLGQLAQAVEVYNYNTEPITNKLVYPVDGWDGTLEVLNVNAGEVAEYQLELNASVTSIQTPTMVENVGPDYKASSVYTVVSNDGLPIPPAQWTNYGGKVVFSINDDSTSLTVTLWGPVGIYTHDGELATNFSLALASDATNNRYSTLRILGSGVKFEKEVIPVSTGVPASATTTEVGETVDNPFLTDLGRVYRVGIAAAVKYAGTVSSVTGTMSLRMNPTRRTGDIAGSKVFDKRSHRWYRLASAQITPDSVNFSADDDLTFHDLTVGWNGKTFAQITSSMEGLTFQKADAAGWGLE